MAQLRDIKDRIDSVTKTRKMTQAMKMVAAAKFKRASDRAIQSRPYLAQMEGLLGSIKDQVSDIKTPLLQENRQTKEAMIIITGDRGLCGGFNANILKKADQFLKSTDSEIDLYIFGAKGYQYYKSRSSHIKAHYEGFFDDISVERVMDVMETIVTGFSNAEYGKVWLFYNEFVSAVTSNQIQKQLLPFEVANVEVAKEDYFLLPSPESIVTKLAHDCVVLNVYKGFLESFAAEQGARMAAMDSATDNAADMISGLKLLYNRQRQAQITTELSEIVAGAEALTA